eukprot:scaffold4280_cov78-Skeletonema_dohrnii-CCMP3373.AAC.2
MMVMVEVEVEVDVDEDDGCMENYLRQERPITDGLVDITAADEDAFNSFHFHIVAIHAAMDGRQKESSRRKRMLLVGSSWLAQAAVSSVRCRSLSHNLIIIIHSSSDATLLQIILLYLSHNALSQTSQCSSPQPSWSVLSSKGKGEMLF